MNEGQREKTFIVAEVSANHGQDYQRAVSMIHQAKECGAEAVKFQAYTPETITLNSQKEFFQINHSPWEGQTLHELYSKAYTPWEWLPKLKKVAEDLELVFFCSAFDRTSVDFLESLAVPIHKVASFEITDIPLIRHMAKTKKPLILSTGVATLNEIEEAVLAAKSEGAENITLLKCVSHYPADPGEMNLNSIATLKEKFFLPVGLSDHTPGDSVAIAAVALGARVIEKHFIGSKDWQSPDNFFSLDPAEFERLVRSIREVERALGKNEWELSGDQKKNRVFTRSLFIASPVKKGEPFTEKNLRSVRPGHGLAPKHFDAVINKKAAKDIEAGTPLDWDLVD